MLNMWRIRDIVDKATNIVMNYTEMESKVREATNDDPWGPSGQIMGEIARATFTYEQFPDVMNMMWTRMLRESKGNWRRAYKSLLLLAYLLRNGSERVVTSAREHLYDLRSLEDFHCVDEHGRDQGGNVRQKVREVIDLVQDDDKVREERKRARKTRDKYIGVSSDTARFGGLHDSDSRGNYLDDYDLDRSRRNSKGDFDTGRKKEFYDSDGEDNIPYTRRSSGQTHHSPIEDGQSVVSQKHDSDNEAPSPNHSPVPTTTGAAIKKRSAVPSKMVDIGAAKFYADGSQQASTNPSAQQPVQIEKSSSMTALPTDVGAPPKSLSNLADMLLDPGFDCPAPNQNTAASVNLFANFPGLAPATNPTNGLSSTMPTTLGSEIDAWGNFSQGPSVNMGGDANHFPAPSVSVSQPLSTNPTAAAQSPVQHPGDLFGALGSSNALSPHAGVPFPGGFNVMTASNPSFQHSSMNQQNLHMQPVPMVAASHQASFGGLNMGVPMATKVAAMPSVWSDSGSVNISLEGLSMFSTPQKAPQPSMNAMMQHQQQLPQAPMHQSIPAVAQGFGNLSIGTRLPMMSPAGTAPVLAPPVSPIVPGTVPTNPMMPMGRAAPMRGLAPNQHGMMTKGGMVGSHFGLGRAMAPSVRPVAQSDAFSTFANFDK
uniref:clathrin interactor 1-like isoform X1 n=2 Tax=Myxine glutinosa TaxID=7769 RepID=UPI00358FF473